MKIAFIGQKGIPAKAGGVERHVEELSTRLAARGHEVYVYARKHYTGFDLEKYKGVKIIYIPSFKTKNLDTITHVFLATIDAMRKDFDIIHFQGVGPSTLAFLPKIFKPKTKVFSTFHCRDQFHQKWGFIARKYLAFGEYAAAKFADKTIAVSKIIAKLVNTKFVQNAEYIPNGVAVLNEFDETVLAKFGLEKGKYILTAGRLVRHKGIHFLIEAFKKLALKDYKLVIVGDGVNTNDYVEELKKLAGNDKNIVFTGFQYGKDLASLFKYAYLYVHPSYSEGLPITVLEAMAYNKAVLVSNIEENIEAFAGNGYMFANKNAEDLAYKMRLLLSNPDLVEKTGIKAREHVLKNYDWENITEKTITVYKRTLREGPGLALERARV